MKGILLAGYFGMGNLGDEAILEGEFKYLREELPGAEIAVLSGNPKRTRENLACQSYHRTALKEVISAISNCHLFILGGGGLLQDITSFRSLLYYLFLLEFAKWRRKKVAVFAVGVGPLRRRISQRLVAKVLRKVDALSLRDKASYEWAKRLGIEKASLSADASFLLPPPSPRERKREIGISLRSWKGLNVYNIKEFLKSVNQKGFSLFYLVFNPADLELSLLLTRETGGKLVEPSSPREALNLLAQMEGTIAMRLHSGILSAIAGTPFLAISYDPKVKTMAEELGQPSLSLEASNIMMRETLEKWFLQKETFRSLLPQKCFEMKKRLEKAIEKIKVLMDTP